VRVGVSSIGLDVDVLWHNCQVAPVLNLCMLLLFLDYMRWLWSFLAWNRCPAYYLRSGAYIGLVHSSSQIQLFVLVYCFVLIHFACLSGLGWWTFILSLVDFHKIFANNYRFIQLTLFFLHVHMEGAELTILFHVLPSCRRCSTWNTWCFPSFEHEHE